MSWLTEQIYKTRGTPTSASRANLIITGQIFRLRPNASERCQCEFTSVPLKPYSTNSPHKMGRKNGQEWFTNLDHQQKHNPTVMIWNSLKMQVQRNKNINIINTNNSTGNPNKQTHHLISTLFLLYLYHKFTKTRFCFQKDIFMKTQTRILFKIKLFRLSTKLSGLNFNWPNLNLRLEVPHSLCQWPF